ncbi:MAG TPA: DUF402 domain-containing protein [Anaerolineaceae bacterium]|nr:DUF402 domain-containing protein [Anaerolineaceae bacterium]
MTAEARFVQVTKLNARGDFVFSYPARLLREQDGARLVAGTFNIESVAVGKLYFRRGDHALEWYSTRRWYNLLQVCEQASKQVKAWYCNICLPADFREDEICWRDLALDLLVYPDGSMELLDQDEFAELALNWQTRAACWRALKEVMRLFKENSLPFQEG